MATRSTLESTEMQPRIVDELKRLLWGGDIKHDVFRRWTQGFVFSSDEHSAMVQLEGGPCSIITPVQTYILKNLLFNGNTIQDWKKISEKDADDLLIQAFLDIQKRVTPTETYTLVICDILGFSGEDDVNQHGSSSSNDGEQPHSPKKRKYSHECFHEHLRCVLCSSNQELEERLKQLLVHFKGDYGVLTFLYSVILTKGIEQLKNEVEDPGEPLIDGTYGHGSQSLINLLVTGKAVSNVWDNDKEVEGLKLQGIKAQATIGFLSLLEHLRYCEVGWYLKNPEYPIWLLASETHLTVLFSTQESLVTKETPDLIAKRLFGTFDPEGNGFIAADLLQDVLSSLELVSEPPEYITIIKNKLDPEQLGIITLNAFMGEFYPDSQNDDNQETFTLYHYNGLPRSCPEKKVVYQEAQAVITNPSDIITVEDRSTILACIQTKWPTIELKWKSGHIPSLN